MRATVLSELLGGRDKLEAFLKLLVGALLSSLLGIRTQLNPKRSTTKAMVSSASFHLMPSGPVSLVILALSHANRLTSRLEMLVSANSR